MVSDISICEFDYPLPDERIARHPLEERDRCKLLLSLPDGRVIHRVFTDLPDLLPPSSLMVANDTKVINARMSFRKSTGAAIEIFLLEPLSPADYALMFQSKGECRWTCLVGNLKRWKEGGLEMKLEIEGVSAPVILTAVRKESLPGGAHAVDFSWTPGDIPFASVVEAAGRIPIPPYLRRESEESDAEDYQTVYAKVKGSVAAPTAGLHFTPRVLEGLAAHNVEVRKVTLHVGAGTFQPVKSDTIGGHPMHTETFVVTRSLVEALLAARREGRRITAVGTTTVRTLESLPYLGARLMRGVHRFVVEQWDPYIDKPENMRDASGFDSAKEFDTDAALEALLDYLTRERLTELHASTSIMIAPGFRWRLVDCMVTNFHQPQSTLLLLVSGFLNRGENDPHDSSLQWRRIYSEALDSDYRFLSYGDACLLFPVR